MYLSAKVFDNFVIVFNQWAVSNKLGSMKDSTLNYNEKKIEEARFKEINLKKICEKYEEEPELDLSEKLITRQETSKLAQSLVNEIHIGGEECFQPYEHDLFLDQDNDYNPLCRLIRRQRSGVR